MGCGQAVRKVEWLAGAASTTRTLHSPAVAPAAARASATLQIVLMAALLSSFVLHDECAPCFIVGPARLLDKLRGVG